MRGSQWERWTINETTSPTIKIPPPVSIHPFNRWNHRESITTSPTTTPRFWLKLIGSPRLSTFPCSHPSAGLIKLITTICFYSVLGWLGVLWTLRSLTLEHNCGGSGIPFEPPPSVSPMLKPADSHKQRMNIEPYLPSFIKNRDIAVK